MFVSYLVSKCGFLQGEVTEEEEKPVSGAGDLALAEIVICMLRISRCHLPKSAAKSDYFFQAVTFLHHCSLLNPFSD
jgi:hypothetical protein